MPDAPDDRVPVDTQETAGRAEARTARPRTERSEPEEASERSEPGFGAEPRIEDAARRSFLTTVGLACGALATALVAVPSAYFLLGLRQSPRVWRPLGKVDDFKVGTTVEVAFADPSPLPWAGVTAQTAAWLRRESETAFTAFAVNCTHLGCPVRWLPDANLFMCPCHGGVFYGDGRVASGPPERPLVTYPVRIREGLVEIETSPLPIMG